MGRGEAFVVLMIEISLLCERHLIDCPCSIMLSTVSKQFIGLFGAFMNQGKLLVQKSREKKFAKDNVCRMSLLTF